MKSPGKILIAAAIVALSARSHCPLAEAPAPGPLNELLPDPILRVQGSPRHVLVVEKDEQLLHLFEFNGEARLLRTIPCTTGKNVGDKSAFGDEKTPEGVYFFTRYIDSGGLVEMYDATTARTYGAGAFPMDYPNFFDRKEGRRGSGIWLHGVEYDGRVQQARDTRGCVAIANDDFRELREIIELRHTPIIVTKSLQWSEREQHARMDREVWQVIDGWRNAWQTKDIEGYIGHYAEDFRTQGMDRDAWKRYKEQFNGRYDWIRVDLEDVGVFKEADDRVLVDFEQRYASDRFEASGRKQLYLRRVDGNWKIWGERYRPESRKRRTIASIKEPEVKIAAASTASVAAAEPALPVPAIEVAAPTSDASPSIEHSALTLETFESVATGTSLQVSFVLRSREDRDHTGYLTVGVLTDDGTPLGNYPEFSTLRNGAPREFRRGEWFFFHGSDSFRFEIPVATGHAQKVVIFAHDRSGELLLQEERPL